jgi:hypothetical protein
MSLRGSSVSLCVYVFSIQCDVSSGEPNISTRQRDVSSEQCNLSSRQCDFSSKHRNSSVRQCYIFSGDCDICFRHRGVSKDSIMSLIRRVVSFRQCGVSSRYCFFRIFDISSRERDIYSRYCNFSSIGRGLFTSAKFIILNFNPRIRINNLLLIVYEAE